MNNASKGIIAYCILGLALKIASIIQVFLIGFLALVIFGVVINPYGSNSDSDEIRLKSRFHDSDTIIKGLVEDITYEEYACVYDDSISKCDSKALIFPSLINEGSVKGFVFMESISNDRGKWHRSEIFVEWNNLNSESFERECERLASIKSYKNKPLISSSDLFSLPSHVAEYNEDGGFEYALIDKKNNSVKYIYLEDVESYSQIVFDYNYAPHKKLKESDFPKERIKWGAYSIYVYYSNEKKV